MTWQQALYLSGWWSLAIFLFVAIIFIYFLPAPQSYYMCGFDVFICIIILFMFLYYQDRMRALEFKLGLRQKKGK